MIPELDRRSVASGAIVGVAVGAVAAITIRLIDVVHDVTTRSNLPLAFAGVVVAGWVAAGWVAAREQPETPLTHGMAAGVASFVVLAVVDALVALARGHGVPGALVLVGILSAVAGMAGGWLSSQRASPRS